MINRKRLTGLAGVASLGVLAALAIAAGGVSVTGPSLEGSTTTGATPTNPSVKPSKVVGHVVSADTTADLKGVRVVLLRDGKATQHTMTNEKGQFVFEKVAPGRFGVAAAKKDLGAGREVAAVKPGDTARVQIELKKPK